MENCFNFLYFKRDPKFGQALRQADKAGVEIYAYTSEFKKDEIVLRNKIEIDLQS